LSTHQFTVMEANFSLFWGLAIQLYESTLIADDTPFDRFMEGHGDALDGDAQVGMTIFLNAGACAGCHATSTFSGQGVNRLGVPVAAPDHTGLVAEDPVEDMMMARSLGPTAIEFSTENSLTTLPLTFDPRGASIELLRNATGPVVFSDVYPGTAGSCIAEETELALTPTGAGDLDPTSAAVASLSVAPFCSTVRFRIDLTAMPPGDYVVRVGGVDRGTIPVLTFAVYDNGF